VSDLSSHKGRPFTHFFATCTPVEELQEGNESQRLHLLPSLASPKFRLGNYIICKSYFAILYFCIYALYFSLKIRIMYLWHSGCPLRMGSLMPSTEKRPPRFYFPTANHSDTSNTFPHSSRQFFHFCHRVTRSEEFQISKVTLRDSNVFKTYRLSQGNLDFGRNRFPHQQTACFPMQ